MDIVAISRDTVLAKTDRGGEMHVLLSPKTVETKTGFMGTLVLAPGEVYGKHYHPYSDEYVYVTEGEVTITGETTTVQALTGTAVFIPRTVPHRLHNAGSGQGTLVFFSCPLAPRPDLGHVLLEDEDK